MSLSYQKVQAIECRDPRVIVDNKRDYCVLKGGSDVTPKTYTTTNISQNSITFTTVPPSANTIIDRKIVLTASVRLTFTGNVPAGGFLLNVNKDAPRAFPLSSAIDTVSAQINGTKVSVDLADVIHPLTRFHTDEKLKSTYYSMSATSLDQSQKYQDLQNTVRNPLAVYGDTVQMSVPGRGSANYKIVQNPQNNTGAPVVSTAIVDCLFSENLFMLAPFIWGKLESGGLYNITSLDFTFNFLTQSANRFWSHDDSAGNNITSATFQFGGLQNGPSSIGFSQAPTLNITWISPPETSLLGPSMAISYPYFQVERYVTDFANIANSPDSYVWYSSSNIQLKSIPRRMYVFMRKRNSDLYANANCTDTYMAINNVNIQFQNRSGIYSTASQQQLYLTAVKNGCNMSWGEWSGLPQYSGSSNFVNSFYGAGSVCCFEFGTDIANQSPLDAPGKSGQYNLQVNVNAANISGAVLNASLYIVSVYEGTFSIMGSGQSLTQIGVLTSNDILDSAQQGYASYQDAQLVNGGDFLSGIKDFFVNKVAPFLRETKLGSTLAQHIPVVGPALSSGLKALGYGEGLSIAGDGLSIAGDGGVLVGGAKMRRKNLRQRLMD